MPFQPHIISSILSGEVRRVQTSGKPYLALTLSEGICIVPIVSPLRKEFHNSFKVLLQACGYTTDYTAQDGLPEMVLAECIAVGHKFKFHKVRRQVLDRYKKPIPNTWAEALYLKEQVK